MERNMYDGYIIASYLATFLPLILLALASLSGWLRARREAAALDETNR